MYAIKSRWDPKSKHLLWLVVYGSIVVTSRRVRSEAEHILKGLMLATDPWTRFRGAIV